MEIVIQNIKMPLEHTIEDVFCAAQEIVRPSCIPLTNLRVYKQSLDARKKHDIHYVYSVAA